MRFAVCATVIAVAIGTQYLLHRTRAQNPPAKPASDQTSVLDLTTPTRLETDELLERRPDTRVTLDVNDRTIGDAINDLSMATGIKFVIDLRAADSYAEASSRRTRKCAVRMILRYGPICRGPVR